MVAVLESLVEEEPFHSSTTILVGGGGEGASMTDSFRGRCSELSEDPG